MSFREKSAWACLLTTAGVYIPYFAYMLILYIKGDLRVASVFPAFVGTVVLQTILATALHVVFALQSRQEKTDERDLAIESRSIKVSYYVLISSGFLGIALVFTFLSKFPPVRDASAAVLMSQILLLCFVGAEVTGYLVQVVCYRRGS